MPLHGVSEVEFRRDLKRKRHAAVLAITGPQADLNLGIKTFFNGQFLSNIIVDTSAAATDTIDYVVTDAQGLTSTSSRTMIVEPATDDPTPPLLASSADTIPTTATLQ